MSVYTVHEPLLRAARSWPNPDRFAFVRDGFSFWAFLLAVPWMLWHRMWLELVVYLVVAAGIESGLRYAGASDWALAIVALALSLLVAMESGTLRRFALGRRGYRTVGVVSAADCDEAERRFFGAWVATAAARPGETPAPPASASLSPVPRPQQTSDVIGSFPEPGGNR
ncbi:MAG: DUF2628 domain-containing protein [Xanthobacteraceae bacterium]